VSVWHNDWPWKITPKSVGYWYLHKFLPQIYTDTRAPVRIAARLSVASTKGSQSPLTVFIVQKAAGDYT